MSGMMEHCEVTTHHHCCFKTPVLWYPVCFCGFWDASVVASGQQLHPFPPNCCTFTSLLNIQKQNQIYLVAVIFWFLHWNKSLSVLCEMVTHETVDCCDELDTVFISWFVMSLRLWFQVSVLLFTHLFNVIGKPWQITTWLKKMCFM